MPLHRVLRYVCVLPTAFAIAIALLASWRDTPSSQRLSAAGISGTTNLRHHPPAVREQTTASKQHLGMWFSSAGADHLGLFLCCTLPPCQDGRDIINVHEHIESAELAERYLEAMDALGVKKVCLLGSSRFTLTLNESDGFTKYDENNRELLQIIQQYPDRFDAWVTIDPCDPAKLSKLRDYVAQGAAGLKLYTGHGYVRRNGQYMFHTKAMNDPSMLPVYAHCQEHYIPICWHVNPSRSNVGFLEEFVSVLEQFPDLKVICPHFMLSSIYQPRLRELLEAFPNLYTDISFGDYFVKDGLIRISRNVDRFRTLFDSYSDRIMFGSDLVLTYDARKSTTWVKTQWSAYLDMLSKDTYTTSLVPGKELRGLKLNEGQLRRVLFKNYDDFMKRQPRNTPIVRRVNWSRMWPSRAGSTQRSVHKGSVGGEQ